MTNKLKKQIETIMIKMKELDGVYREAALKSGIPYGEFCVWSALIDTEQEYSQQGLSDLLSFPIQTINSIITNLKKRELVYLEHIPGSRNKKVIRLTEKGKEYGKDKVEWILKAEQKAIEEADIEEVRVCISLLGKYILSLRKQLDETEK